MLLQKYTASWRSDFEEIKAVINSALKNQNIQIEHVGSTAIPNLDAKPIIDIDIIFTDLDSFEILKSALLKIGYYHNGDQGIPDREVFKRLGTLNHPVLDTKAHHLYVCPSHSKALQRHLRTRDYLAKNETARKYYQEMKYTLAHEANQDRKVYATLKELRLNDFIDSIVEKESLENPEL